VLGKSRCTYLLRKDNSQNHGANKQTRKEKKTKIKLNYKKNHSTTSCSSDWRSGSMDWFTMLALGGTGLQKGILIFKFIKLHGNIIRFDEN
jgi:hypothetical protein